MPEQEAEISERMRDAPDDGDDLDTRMAMIRRAAGIAPANSNRRSPAAADERPSPQARASERDRFIEQVRRALDEDR